MKNLLIISPKVGYESASALAEYMSCDYENPYKTKNKDFLNYKFVFKYGYSKKIKANAVFNKAKNLKMAKDKIQTLELLKNCILTVPHTLDKEIALSWLPTPVVARSTSTSNNGIGITYCNTKTDVEKANAIFYTKYQYHTNEFRINIWRDKVVSVYDKVHNKGFFKFKLFQGAEDNQQLVEITKQIYSKIGLDWYGLDVLRDSGGNLILLEVNSAPILFPYTLKRLASILTKEIANEQETN